MITKWRSDSFCILFRSETVMFLVQFITMTVVISPALGCGVTTHVEISHRAEYFFADIDGSLNYRGLILNHSDALMAGSGYPDSFYDSFCALGQYHSVSEDTHWAPFLNASVNYIRKTYPRPWDEATEKLVVFLFGVVSHQVADIVWHSLGIDQGFISTMANVNFNASYPDAHTTADLGGDVLTWYEFPVEYIPLTTGWYIPTGDLFNIYAEYYGNSSVIPKDIINDCSTEMFVVRAAEELAIQKLYPLEAAKSPFLVDQFENFFLGGLEDMVGWTTRLWEQTVTMLDKGTGVCDIPKSTLFLDCKNVRYQSVGQSVSQASKYPSKNGYYVQRPRLGLTQDDIKVEKYLRGVRVTPKQSLLDKIATSKMKKKQMLDKFPKQEQVVSNILLPEMKLFPQESYAKLGWAFATGDLNSDGNEDLVVTAPGYGTSSPYYSNPQQGRVYIIYGTEDGIPSNMNTNVDMLEKTTPKTGQILTGWETFQSRFGSSVAVVDINLDGTDDLAVGVPAAVGVGDDPLNYNGWVMIYFGNPSKHEVARGAANITIACSKVKYCNFGFTMTTGDVNNDGHPDLIVGSPFAPAGGIQRGFIAALEASKLNTGYQYIEAADLKWQKNGDQDYAWFGYDVFTHTYSGNDLIFVGQPQHKLCFDNKHECIESKGRLLAYSMSDPASRFLFNLTGDVTFNQLGTSGDVGRPYTDGSYMLATSAVGHQVSASLGPVDVDFPQGGQIFVYNISGNEWKHPVSLTRFSGDRLFGRFGSKVKFLDLNHDQYDDLVIAASLRSDDITEEIIPGQEGKVFIYFGGPNFPTGDATGKCGNSFVRPCPQYTASVTLEWPQNDPSSRKGRFGSNFALLKSKNKKQLIVAAEHISTDKTRMSGALGVFTF